MGRRGETETAQAHPFHFTNTMADLAASKGVDIRLGAKVTNITSSSSSPNGRVDTVEYVDRNNNDETKTITDVTDVILTAGPWTGKILPRSKIEGLRAHSVVYEAEVSPYAVFTDIELPSEWTPEHRREKGQKRKHRGHVDPEIYARPFGEAYACGMFTLHFSFIRICFTVRFFSNPSYPGYIQLGMTDKRIKTKQANQTKMSLCPKQQIKSSATKTSATT